MPTVLFFFKCEMGSSNYSFKVITLSRRFSNKKESKRTCNLHKKKDFSCWVFFFFGYSWCPNQCSVDIRTLINSTVGNFESFFPTRIKVNRWFFIKGYDFKELFAPKGDEPWTLKGANFQDQGLHYLGQPLGVVSNRLQCLD